MANVTAYVLSEDIAADFAQIPGLPGVWSHDDPILPAALEMTLADLREVVDTLNLPLVEVSVSEGEANDEFPELPNHYPSAPESVGVFAQEEQPVGETAEEAVRSVGAPDTSATEAAVAKAKEK